MRISELLKKESIAIGKEPRDKTAAIDQLVELLAKSGNLKDKGKFRQAILEREALSTTGIGEGIAIPHGKSSAVKKAALAAMVVPKGVMSRFSAPSVSTGATPVLRVTSQKR